MAIDAFLKIDGITGESQDDKHKDEIHIGTFSYGIKQKTTAHTGGGVGAGKAEFHDFVFTKPLDKSSPVLLAKCAGGDHIAKAVLSVRKSGGGSAKADYTIVTLSNVFVSSYNLAGDEEGHDTTTLSYTKIEFEYKLQKEDGSLGGSTKNGWDLKTNKAT